jgi:Bacterial PH domain
VNVCDHGVVSNAPSKPSRIPEDSTTLRSRFGRVLVVFVWVVCAGVVVSLVAQFNLSDFVKSIALVALAAYGIWLLFWSPSVTIAPSGVTVRNILREHAISWPAIQRVDTRYALTIYTSGRKITSWSAPAPSRFAAMRAPRLDLTRLPESSYDADTLSVRPGDIPQSASGQAALYVRRYWQQLRSAGYLDSGVIEGTGVVTRWLRNETVILLGLVVLSAISLALPI